MDVLEVRREHFYPQISLRYYKEMNQDIYDRALRILGSGSTFPMLYNDDVNVPAVMRAMDAQKGSGAVFVLWLRRIYAGGTEYRNAKYSP